MKIRFLQDHRVFKKTSSVQTQLASRKLRWNCDDPHRDTSSAGGINFHGGWAAYHPRAENSGRSTYSLNDTRWNKDLASSLSRGLRFEALNFKTIRGIIIADLMACSSVAWSIVLVDWTNVEDSSVRRGRERKGDRVGIREFKRSFQRCCWSSCWDYIEHSSTVF